MSSIVKRPIITEKSISLAQESNIYSFEVDRHANKDQIKAAVEKLFDVKVERVNTTKKYRVKKRTGRKRLPVLLAPVKKALVKVQDGQTISLFDLGQ